MIYTINMLLTSKPEVKELIVQILAQGAIDSVELQEKVIAKKSITKQGFYKALRELVVAEVVAKNKQLVVLNNLWINKLQAFVTSVDEQYKQNSEFIALQEGENLLYHFRTLESLDILWMHHFFLIAKQFPSEPIVFYNSHEFWSLFRHQEQSLLYQWIKEHKREVYLVIGGDTQLDRETTQYIKDFGITIHYSTDTGFRKNYFSTAIGEYVIETILDMNTTHAVDTLYKKHSSWNTNVEKELSEILKNLKRSKVVIERNHKKAELLRKKLMKYFVFYK